MNPRFKTIYLFVMDDDMPEENVQKYVKYMKAYFLGMDVKVMKQGSTITVNRKKTKVPKDFIKECKIATRERPDLDCSQINARDILHEVKKFKPDEAFCVCCITE